MNVVDKRHVHTTENCFNACVKLQEVAGAKRVSLSSAGLCFALKLNAEPLIAYWIIDKNNFEFFCGVNEYCKLQDVVGAASVFSICVTEC